MELKEGKYIWGAGYQYHKGQVDALPLEYYMLI